MEWTLLLLLASFQFLPQLVSSAARHPAPTFSVHPQKDEYLLGDTVSLMCSAKHVGKQFPVFQYYNNMGWAATTRTSSTWNYTYNFNITETRNGGLYSCSYYTGRVRNYVHSEESNHINIRVKDPPPKPVLSMDPPLGVVSEGYPLHITCTAPEDTGEKRFHFYKDGEELLSGDAGSEIMTKEPGNDTMKVSVLSISRAGPNSTGEFTCKYEENMGVRWIPSPRSQPVTVTLKDPPPQPVLSVDPPSRAVREGQPLHITCVAPGDAEERRFHFYKDGAKIVPGNARSDISLTEPGAGSKNVSALNYPRAGLNSAGEFTCGYEENVGGRWIPSPRSQPVTVTVKDPLPSPVLSVNPASGVVIKGFPLHITCTARGDASEWRFHFYKDGAKIIAGEQGSEISPMDTGTGSMMLTFPKAGPGSNGEFTCDYEENVSGRWLPSPRSQPVIVSMKDSPPPPSLSVDPPSGVVSKGLPLHITCTAPRDTSERRFHFYSNGTEIVPGDVGQELSTSEPGSAVLKIPKASANNTGKFTCGYEEHVDRWWVSSPRSKAMTITVTVPVDSSSVSIIPLVAGCSCAVVALLLLICLCKRTKKAHKWQLRRRPKNDDSVSSYSPIPLAMINPDTL